MPKTSETEIEVAGGASGVELAKMLAVKTAVTVGTIIAVGIVSAVIEKKLGEKKA